MINLFSKKAICTFPLMYHSRIVADELRDPCTPNVGLYFSFLLLSGENKKHVHFKKNVIHHLLQKQVQIFYGPILHLWQWHITWEVYLSVMSYFWLSSSSAALTLSQENMLGSRVWQKWTCMFWVTSLLMLPLAPEILQSRLYTLNYATVLLKQSFSVLDIIL